MSPAATQPTESVGSLAIGVCAPADYEGGEIRNLLECRGHAVARWHPGLDEALAVPPEDSIDVFLIVWPRPTPQTLQAIAALSEAPATAKAILICKRCGERDVRRALDAGARAVLAEDQLEEALLPVIEVVLAGQVSVPGAVGRGASREVLTTREKQILGQVVLGMTNAEIAAKLFLAESTVKSHLSSAFAKLGVTSRNEASALILDPNSAVGLGILTIPSKKIPVSG